MSSRLQGETGATPTEMRAEISRMMATLEPLVDQMDDYEQRFMMSMADNLTSDSWTPTPKQLFKARDINEKY
jgi:hypothetical protein